MEYGKIVLNPVFTTSAAFHSCFLHYGTTIYWDSLSWGIIVLNDFEMSGSFFSSSRSWVSVILPTLICTAFTDLTSDHRSGSLFFRKKHAAPVDPLKC